MPDWSQDDDQKVDEIQAKLGYFTNIEWPR